MEPARFCEDGGCDLPGVESVSDPMLVSGAHAESRRPRGQPLLSLTRIGLSLAAVVGLLAATLAAATIWLLFTDPVTVADAVSEGDGTLLRQLAAVIFQAILRIARYL